jgi:uncharacterized protein (TIGR02246 family)
MPDESTTPDLVERTRLAFEAWNRVDLDAFMNFFASDAVWEAVPLGQSFEGAAAIRSFLADWRCTYEEYEIEPQEIRDLGNGVVLSVVSQITRLIGSTTRTPMREAWAFVGVWIDGTVVRFAAYSDIGQARAAAERLAEERG